MSEGETRSRESGSGEEEPRWGGEGREGGGGQWEGGEGRGGNRDLLQKHDSMCSVLAVSLKAADPLFASHRFFLARTGNKRRGFAKEVEKRFKLREK